MVKSSFTQIWRGTQSSTCDGRAACVWVWHKGR